MAATISETAKNGPLHEIGYTYGAELNYKNIWTLSQTNGILETFCSLIVVMLNLVEITILKRLKRKLSAYEMFLLSLSYSDLLFALSNIAAVIVEIYTNFKDVGDESISILSHTTNILYLVFVTISILHLNGMAFDRLWAIYNPLKHNIIVTRRRARIFLFFVWLSCAGVCVTLLLSGKLTKVGHYSVLPDHNETTPFIDDGLYDKENITYNDISRESYFEDSYINSSFETLNETLSEATLEEKFSVSSASVGIVLSYIIICGDVMLVAAYATIIFYILRKQHRNKDSKMTRNNSKRYNRVLSVCVSITIGFVSLTLPYALYQWNSNWNRFWGNLLLVVNSGLNSAVFLFSQRFKGERNGKHSVSNTKRSTFK